MSKIQVVENKSKLVMFSDDIRKNLFTLFENKEYQKLLDIISPIIKKNPNEYILSYLKGLSFAKLNNFKDAIPSLKTALKINSQNLEIYNHIGMCYKLIGEFDSAQKYFEIGLELKTDDFNIMTNLANLSKEKGDFSKAIKLYNRCIELNTDNQWGIYYNIGLIHQLQNNIKEAIENYEISIKKNPYHADTYTSLSECLLDTNDTESAYKLLQKSQKLENNNFRTQHNLGVYYKHKDQTEIAIECFENSIKLKANNYQSYYSLGIIYSKKKDYLKSIFYLNKSININNKFHKAISQKLNKHSILFDWDEIEKHSHLIPFLGVNGETIDPLTILYLEDSPQNEYKRVTNIGSKYLGSKSLIPSTKKPNKKIKIGYFSSCFYTHAEMLLLIGVLEKHDKNNFEIIAYSLNKRIKDKMTERIKRAVNSFHEISHYDDRQISQFARNDNLDIAIYLNGYTENGRYNIFMDKVAPIQINFLGYPGSLGLDFFDYIIADKIVIPETFKKFYTENVIYLPNTYLPTDNKRLISNKEIKRSDFGLPKTAFVLCCFHNNVKITKDVFLVWLKILERNKNCVLWLKDIDNIAKKNLFKLVSMKNINKNRIIFAKILEMDKYLASYKLADLFLDTFNYNGHTTVSESLWAGTPVITKIGKSFSARVAASLLNAIDMPDLIVKNNNDYIDLVLDISLNKEKFYKIKTKLADNIKTKPLFNTTQYTQNLETVFKNIISDLYK